jgi:hypothetical protein
MVKHLRKIWNFCYTLFHSEQKQRLREIKTYLDFGLMMISNKPLELGVLTVARK